MAERLREACFISDKRSALFAKSHAFLSDPTWASGAIWALYLKGLRKRNSKAQFYRENVSFIGKTAK